MHHIFSTLSSTSKIADHLWKCQRTDIDGKHKAAASSAPITAPASGTRRSASTTNSTATRRSASAINANDTRQPAPAIPLVGLGTSDRLKWTLIRLIVSLQINLSIVENQVFHQMMLWFSPTLAAFIPKEHHIMRDWLMEAYRQKQTILKGTLKRCKSNVHLSFNLWTSSHNGALLAVVGHFVDENYNIRSIILALRRVKGSHSGENLAHTILQVIDEYDLRSQFGYFVLDNAESNDKCVEVILQSLNPSLQKTHRRLHCIGHIINLAAQALLIGDDYRVFEADIRYAQALGDREKELAAWRERGPLGKLHNIVEFIRSTPQRREEFLAIPISDDLNESELDKLMAIQDDATRWNSADGMMKRALKLNVRIDTYCSQHSNRSPNGSLADDCLTGEDWRTLTELHEILKPFKEVTLIFEGRGSTGSYGSAWEVLPTIHHLLTKTKEKEVNYHTLASLPEGDAEYHHIRRSLTSCINQLQKDRGLVLQSPIYAAATAMNPTRKWRWLLKTMPEALGPAQLAVQRVWNDFYRDNPQLYFSEPGPSARLHSQASQIHDDSDDSFDDALLSADPYLKYINSPRVRKEECNPDDLAGWWRNHVDHGVSRMAWDTLCIPAMSADCERVFSSASRSINGYQDNLKMDAIEAIECLKAWYSQDF